MRHIPDIIQNAARNLRNNMTPAEIHLWWYIKDKNIEQRFMRQKPLYVYTEDSWLDRFIIADFYCHNKKLVIELDGSVHLNPDIQELDKHKEFLLKQHGITVIRFSNHQIFWNIEDIMNQISSHF